MICLICGALITFDPTLRVKVKQVYKEFFDILNLNVDNYKAELKPSVHQSFCNKCCSELNHISRVLSAFKLLEEEIEKFKANLKDQLVRTHKEQSKITAEKEEKWKKNVQIIRRKVCKDLSLLPDGNIDEGKQTGIDDPIPESRIEISDIKSWIDLNLEEENEDDNDPFFDDDTSPDYEPIGPTKSVKENKPRSISKLNPLEISEQIERLKEEALKNRVVIKIKKLEDMTVEEIKVQTYLASISPRKPTGRIRKSQSDSGTEFEFDPDVLPQIPPKRLFPSKKRKMFKPCSFRPGDPCTVCGEKFFEVGELNQHILVVHNNEVYACPICPKMFKYQTSMRKHFNYIHNNVQRPKEHRDRYKNKPRPSREKDFKSWSPCIICKEKFETKELMDKHLLEAHNNEVYKCHLCSKSFKMRFSLKRHLKNKHVGEKMNLSDEKKIATEVRRSLCPICGVSVIALRKHMPIHDEAQNVPVKCDICNKVLKSQKSYNLHFKLFHSATANDFMCQICGKTFGCQAKLKLHEDHVHLGNQRFQCEVCQKKLASNSKLREHLRIKHEGHTYACGIDNCEKKYYSRTQLNYHKMNHSGMRPHACSFCNKGFKTKREVAIHETTHTPHITRCSCEICGKKFTHQNYLTLHMFWHNKMEKLGKSTGGIRKRKKRNAAKKVNVENESSSEEEEEQYHGNNTIRTMSVAPDPALHYVQF